MQGRKSDREREREREREGERESAQSMQVWQNTRRRLNSQLIGLARVANVQDTIVGLCYLVCTFPFG